MKTGSVLTAILALCTMCGWAQTSQFPYPTIPQELKTPTERMTYLLEHYWDDYNFCDTTLIHDEKITEQGFVNFIDLLFRVDSLMAEHSIEAFANKALKGGKMPHSVSKHFCKLAEHYLYSPNSPMRSDALYTMFLRHINASQWTINKAECERNEYILRNIVKNSVGEKATDFTYIDRNGKRSTLYETEGELTMLYFNDPDCDNCHAITAELSKDSLIVNNRKLTVIAIYPDEDTNLWLRHRQPFPHNWIDTYSPQGEITARQLYFIRATPTIYLLDKQKRVILKDPSPKQLQAWIAQKFKRQ